MSLSSILYKLARELGRASSAAKDLETLATRDPAKITKRAIRKTIYKASNEAARKITKNIK